MHGIWENVKLHAEEREIVALFARKSREIANGKIFAIFYAYLFSLGVLL